MSVVLLRNKKAAEYPLLPQSVYDDFADTGVSVITLPKGRWYLPKEAEGFGALNLNRSGLVIEASGCTLMLQPDPSTFLPVRLQSVPVTSPTYALGRTASHLTGTIVPSTTTLTMDPAEICDLAPGEHVVIEAGVNITDPNEPSELIEATVASVDLGTGNITFTAPLGITVVDYVNADGLALVVTDPGQQTKFGDWGTLSVNGSLGRGYGTDHGLERFVGGDLVHDVTVNDLTLRIDRVPAFDVGAYAFVGVLCDTTRDVTINRLHIHNPFGNAVHHIHSFTTTLNDVQTTGFGRARINQGPGFPAIAVVGWGGTGLTLNRLDVRSTDTVALSTEVSVRDLVVNDLQYEVVFTAVCSYQPSPVILGTFSTANPAVYHNIRLHVTSTGGSLPTYWVGAPVSTGVLNVDGPLIATFDWTSSPGMLGGTVMLDGVTYGPPVTTTFDRTVVHGAASRIVTMPIALYTSLTIQVIDAGDLREIDDLQFTYDNLTNRAILPARANQWASIQAAGQPFDITAYRASAFTCWMNNAGSTADGLLRFVAISLPEVV